jgi:hypothetical protein
MNLTPLCEGELRYVELEFLDFKPGGQYVGTLEGSLRGEQLNGRLRLLNLPQKRPDDVNCPQLRGVLYTDDGAKIYVAFDGIALLRPSDDARVFMTSTTFRTGDEGYRWLNTVFAVTEGILDTAQAQGTARFRVYRCEASLT